ncbi:MAG: hypothetical protein H7Y13_13595 [Sphingobacteriaceae bacterium]|nr:hypothetical protein [Sphingobacteriaceae bacterium]
MIANVLFSKQSKKMISKRMDSAAIFCRPAVRGKSSPEEKSGCGLYAAIRFKVEVLFRFWKKHPSDSIFI